ncbi:hypothetical protein [Streptomyces roseifaciens]|uniref:hypothetical protein n=1 Tax=Streptomyces roseifaciens TaxID=1488406 RepID=UPI000A57FC29|nr:hypothetical protein [Streptomyces roseifaciens]
MLRIDPSSPAHLNTIAQELRELANGLTLFTHNTPETAAFTAGARMKALGGISEMLSNTLLYNLTGEPSADRAERRGAGALATAAAGTSQAMGHLAEALQQVAFLQEHATRRPGPDLADAQQAAWNVIGDRLDDARTALQNTATQLETDTRHLTQPPRRPAPRSAVPTAQAQQPPTPVAVPTTPLRRPAP